MSKNKLNIPTEIVELPSQGLIYPESSILSDGKIEMKYMTAREEDILTNQNYISKGIVLDELVKSLIVSEVDYDDMCTGDKNAILVAARILGYGKDYSFSWGGEEYTIDLTTIDNKPLDKKLFNKGTNEFNFELPSTGIDVTFKLLTNHDEKKIKAELDGLKKINKNSSTDMSTRLKYIITSVNGNRDSKDIREFIDTMLARDSRALREYIKEVQPDVDLTFFPNGSNEKVSIPVGLSFFWPDI
jgi:hypothetical protein